MKAKHKMLLFIDGIVNLIIGILLLLFPVGVDEMLGVPKSNIDFYPTLLGAVIFGIGVALLVERYGYSRNVRGLGLGGAIVINICAVSVLFVWLLTTQLNIPLRGYIILWSIVVMVLVIAVIEIITKSWIYKY